MKVVCVCGGGGGGQCPEGKERKNSCYILSGNGERKTAGRNKVNGKFQIQ